MKVEEIALRHEIRQMLNEAGFNKNTIKGLVKEVLQDELKRAIKQACNETDITKDYIERNIDRIVKDTTREVLKERISDRLTRSWFDHMHVTVDITDANGALVNKEV